MLTNRIISTRSLHLQHPQILALTPSTTKISAINNKPQSKSSNSYRMLHPTPLSDHPACLLQNPSRPTSPPSKNARSRSARSLRFRYIRRPSRSQVQAGSDAVYCYSALLRLTARGKKPRNGARERRQKRGTEPCRRRFPPRHFYASTIVARAHRAFRSRLIKIN